MHGVPYRAEGPLPRASFRGFFVLVRCSGSRVWSFEEGVCGADIGG